MKKIREVTNRIAAMLLSGMLVVGSVPGTVLATDFQADPGQTSVVAAEELEEIPSEETPMEESVEEGMTLEEASVEDNSLSEAPQEDNAVTSYTVTLDANGGYFENVWDDVLNETLEKTETVTKLIPVGGTVADFPVYVDQDGQSKAFAGWSLEKDGELITTGDEEYAPVDNCALNAVWKEDDSSNTLVLEEMPQEEFDNSNIESAEQTDAVWESRETGTPEESDVDFEETAIPEMFDEMETEEGSEYEPEGFSSDETIFDTGDNQDKTSIQEDNNLNEDIDENIEEYSDTAVAEEETEVGLIEPSKEEEIVREDAVKGAVASGTCGDNLAWTLDNVGFLTISGTGEMDNFTFNGPWENSQVKDVLIKSGVTSIGNNAFHRCLNLKSVTISSGVSRIGGNAFFECGDLINITIPATVTTILPSAFCGCSSLTSISIPSGVTEIGDYAFSRCSSLKSISIPKVMTKISRGTFSGCSSLSSLVIPSGVTVIGMEAFNNCSSLTNMTIPESVTTISSSTFEGCCNLQSVSIPKKVNDIDNYAFSGCYNLKDITFPSGLTHIGMYAFSECKSLTSITIPSGVTSINDGTFNNCTNLKKVNIPSNVTSIGAGAFNKCTSLTSVIIPSNINFIGEYTFKNCSSLSSLYFKCDCNYYVEKLVYRLPDTVKIYYPYNNNNWVSITKRYQQHTWIPWDPDSGLDITSTDGCEVLNSGTCGDSLTWAVIEDKDLYLQHTQTDKIIRQVSLYPHSEGNETKGLLIGGIGEMYDYDSAEDVPWYEYDISYVVWAGRPVSIGNHAFDGIDLGDKAEPIPDSVERIGAYAFAGRGRRDIVLPASVRSIESHAFGGYKYKTGSGGSLELNTNVSLYFQGSMPESLTSDCLAGSEGTIYFLYDNETWREIYYNPTSYQFGAAGSLGGGSDTVINYKPFSGDINNLKADGKKGYVYGTISSVNASEHSVTIEGKTWYFAHDCDQISVAQEILDGQYSSKKVICGTDYDYIKIITPLENVVRRTITIDSGDPIQYENGTYSVDSRKCKLIITYGIVSTKYYSTEDLPSIINDSFTLKNLRIGPDKDAEEKALVQEFTNFTGNNWDSNLGTIKISEEVTVKYGEKKTLYFTIHPLLSPGNVNSSLALNVHGEDEDGKILEGFGTIRFHNHDLQLQKAEDRKKNEARTVNISVAETALRACPTVDVNAFPNLMNILDSQQKKAVQDCINLRISQMIITKKCIKDSNFFKEIIQNSFKDNIDMLSAKIQDKVMSKVLGKLGIDKDHLLVPGKKADSITIAVDTKYGPCTLKFDLDLATVAFANSDPFAAFGTLTCTVNGLTDDQVGTFRSIGANVTFTDTKALCSAMKEMMISSIGAFYSEAYGKDADKAVGLIADMMTNYPVSALLNQYGVSVSGTTYKITVKAIENSYKQSSYRKTTIHCPVDIYVYDGGGNLCGAIINNNVDSSYDELGMYVDGDDKTIFLTGDDYHLKYVGNGNGAMDVDVTYYDDEGAECRSLLFESIPLDNNLEYESIIPETHTLVQDVYEIYKIKESDEEEVISIQPVYDSLQQEIVNPLGIVIDQVEATCMVGNSFVLHADVVPTEAFDKTVNWASDNEKVISVDQEGRVTALSPGTANVSATSREGGFSTKCRITVKNTSLEKAIISNIKTKNYTGKAHSQTPVVKMGNEILVPNTDYNISYKNNVNAGTATVIIAGKGKYTGSIKKTFKITPQSLAKASVSNIKTKVWTGKAQSQSPTVKLGKLILKKGTHYTVSINNNKAAGIATLIIKGKGNYKGTLKKTFRINPKSTSISKLTAISKGFVITWKKQALQTTGYQIQYSTDKAFKSNTVTKTINKNAVVTSKITGLKSAKIYYVRIRTYKKIGNTNVYSSWSKLRQIKTKDVPNVTRKVLYMTPGDAAKYLGLIKHESHGGKNSEYACYSHKGCAYAAQLELVYLKELKNAKGYWDLVIKNDSIAFQGVKIGMSKKQTQSLLKRNGWILDHQSKMLYSNTLLIYYRGGKKYPHVIELVICIEDGILETIRLSTWKDLNF